MNKEYISQLLQEVRRLHQSPYSQPDDDKTSDYDKGWGGWTRNDIFTFAKNIIETTTALKVAAKYPYKLEDEVIFGLEKILKGEIVTTVPENLKELIKKYEAIKESKIEDRATAHEKTIEIARKLRAWSVGQSLQAEGVETTRVVYEAQKDEPIEQLENLPASPIRVPQRTPEQKKIEHDKKTIQTPAITTTTHPTPHVSPQNGRLEQQVDIQLSEVKSGLEQSRRTLTTETKTASDKQTLGPTNESKTQVLSITDSDTVRVKGETPIPKESSTLFIATAKNIARPALQELAKALASIPAQILLTFSPRPATSNKIVGLAFKTGITSKQLTKALSIYKNSPGYKLPILEALTKQIQNLEQYEKNNPLIAKIIAAAHSSEEITIVVFDESQTNEENISNLFTKIQPNSITQLVVDHQTQEVIQTQTLLKPKSVQKFIRTLTAQSPPRAVAESMQIGFSNTLSRLQIAIKKFQVDLPRILFQKSENHAHKAKQKPWALANGSLFGSGKSISPPTETALPNSLPTPSTLSSGRGILSYLGRGTGFGFRMLGNGGVAAIRTLLPLGGKLIGALGSLGGIGAAGTAAGAGAAGAGTAGAVAAGGTGVAAVRGTGLLIGVIVVVVVLILLGFLTVSGHQGAYLAAIPDVQVESEFIDVRKTTQQTVYGNDNLPDQLTYAIGIKPKRGKLTEVVIGDETRISSSSINKQIDQQRWEANEITRSSWTQEFSIPLSPDAKKDMADSLVINTVTVQAKVEGEVGVKTAITKVVIRVGNPPENCPMDWPTAHGSIRQGPDGTSTHNIPGQTESIDIDYTIGTPVYATHGGTAYLYNDKHEGLDVYITGNCNGVVFESWYVHLATRSIESGDPVTRGTVIGTLGQTGYASYPHLHYMFMKNLSMEPPYIPTRVPRRCVENCNVQW